MLSPDRGRRKISSIVGEFEFAFISCFIEPFWIETDVRDKTRSAAAKMLQSDVTDPLVTVRSDETKISGINFENLSVFFIA